MRTDNRDSEKDLNANPESRLNTNKPVSKPDREKFPESHEAQEEIERKRREEENKDADIELLASDVSGTVSSRDTSSNPEDIAGVADLDRGMRRSKRR